MGEDGESMTVKELIEKLKEQDPKAKVRTLASYMEWKPEVTFVVEKGTVFLRIY